MPRASELAEHRSLHGEINVCIFENDKWSVAAELDGHVSNHAAKGSEGDACTSRLHLFRVPAASLASIFPTPVLPVKLNFFTIGFVANSVAAARSFVGHTWIIFPGIPASTASLVSAAHVYGVSLGGLITTEQPAANAGAILRVIIAAGKFQGVMIPQTPTGSLKVRTVVLGYCDGIVSPYDRVASSANHDTNDAA